MSDSGVEPDGVSHVAIWLFDNLIKALDSEGKRISVQLECNNCQE